MFKDGPSLPCDAGIRSQQLQPCPTPADYDLLLPCAGELADDGGGDGRGRGEGGIVEVHREVGAAETLRVLVSCAAR